MLRSIIVEALSNRSDIELLAADGPSRADMSQVDVVLTGSIGFSTLPPEPQLDSRVDRVLGLIEARHCEPSLTIGRAARDVRLSRWHLGRLLKQHTGHGFLSHVHRARVLSARRLLEGSDLSIKEIAAAVGYASSQQLDRHFKRIVGDTPLMCRQKMSARQSHDRITNGKN